MAQVHELKVLHVWMLIMILDVIGLTDHLWNFGTILHLHQAKKTEETKIGKEKDKDRNKHYG